jgi:hypothetical protein
MPRYEYKVVPAPNKGVKAKGVKGAEARFSHALQELMNSLSCYGWEYQRAETLPSIERSGIASSTTEWRNVLIFRRLRENDADAFAPELLPSPRAMPVDMMEDPPAEPRAEKTDGAAASTDAGKPDGDAKKADGADGHDQSAPLDGHDKPAAEEEDPDTVTARFKGVAASLKPDPEGNSKKSD